MKSATGRPRFAFDHLVEQSYDPAIGARPARRAIQRLLRNPLSLMLLREEIREGDTVSVGMKDGAPTFKPKSADAKAAAGEATAV